MILGHLSVVVDQSCVLDTGPCFQSRTEGTEKTNDPGGRYAVTRWRGKFPATLRAEPFGFAEDYRKFGLARFNSAAFHRYRGAQVSHDVRRRPHGGIAVVSDDVL